jgi:Xaa-Pro aminopeptidase
VVSWPRDDAKLERVRALMAEEDVDALCVRAPDNVLYLSNFLPMKGYDMVVFPREGDATLIALEPSLADAQRMAWTDDLRLFKGYHEGDPRPPAARALELAQRVCRERGLERIGLELSQGTQTADRMLGEPTTPTAALFEAFENRTDASPLLAQARAIKTEQEVERMRLANELAALALERVREQLRPGMTEAEAAAAWEGAVHAIGTGFEGKVENARGYSLVWSGPGIRTFTATSNRPIAEHEPTLFEIWVSADGYWCDHTKNLCPGELDPRYAELERQLLDVYERAVDHCRDGAGLAELDRLVRDGIADAGYPGQPSHPIAHGVGARAHEPPYAHQAGSGTIRRGMVLAIEPGIYWEGGGGLRVEDNWLVTDGAPEKLCRFPDGIVRC